MAFGFRPVIAGVATIALLSMAQTGLVSSAIAQSSSAPLPAPMAVASLPSAAQPAGIVSGGLVFGGLVSGLEDQSTLRSTAPTSSALLQSQPSDRDSWTIALVQTALAEKGCRDIAINGAWDQPTEVATLTALALPQRPERITLDDNLVRLVRSAPATICPPWTWGAELGSQPRERRLLRAPPGEARSATIQGRKPAAAKAVQQSARQVKAVPATPRATSIVRVARANVSVARMTVSVPAF